MEMFQGLSIREGWVPGGRLKTRSVIIRQFDTPFVARWGLLCAQRTNDEESDAPTLVFRSRRRHFSQTLPARRRVGKHITKRVLR